MRILALDRPLPGATPEQFQAQLINEVRHAWLGYKRGLVRDFYFRQDRPGVALLLECSSVEEAQKALAEFPLAKAGVLEFEVIPLGPFTNWELLFATTHS